MKKIISIVGTRPNYIKLAAIEKFLSGSFLHKIINTGQHYDYEMAENFFREFSFPKIDFNLEVGSSLPGKQTAEIISRTESILIKEKPDMVIVYGDTNSTLGGALAAVKSTIPCVHIEAGIRSFDNSMPEEINRILVDHSSNLLLAPTKSALINLKNENIKKGIFFVGDLMYDLFLEHSNKALENYKNLENYYYCTIHREENTSANSLKTIFNNLETLPQKVIFPIHPRTKKVLNTLKINLKNIKFIQPQGYTNNLNLINNSIAVITDSGGIQKEAFWFKVPCFTIRKSTEWPETVLSGWNKLLGANFKKEDFVNIQKPKSHKNYFGKGTAAKKIVSVLKNYL